jgi:hypothetical protein
MNIENRQAWIEESVRRVVVHLSASRLGESDWQRVAIAVGATPG